MKRIEIINRQVVRNWLLSIIAGTSLLTLFLRWHEFNGDFWSLFDLQEMSMFLLIQTFSSGIALLCSLPALVIALFIFQHLAKWNLPKIQVRYYIALLCTALTYGSFQIIFPSVHADIMIASALLCFAGTFIFLLDDKLLSTISRDFVEEDMI